MAPTWDDIGQLAAIAALPPLLPGAGLADAGAGLGAWCAWLIGVENDSHLRPARKLRARPPKLLIHFIALFKSKGSNG
jgi:hypothetical protein